MQQPTQAERDEQRRRHREQTLAKFRRMGEAAVRARYSSLNTWDQPIAAAYLNEVDEENALRAGGVADRERRADRRDELRLRAMWLAVAVSSVAGGISLLALFRPDWANLPPLH